MELPEFNIIRDDTMPGVRIWFTHQYDLAPILPAIEYEMCKQFLGESMTHNMLDTMRMRIASILEGMCLSGYILKLDNGEWRVNILEFVANKLSHAIRCGKIVKDIPWHGSIDKQMLARCLVDADGELYDQIKSQSTEIIEWFAAKLNQPVLDYAIEKLKNEIIIDIANIK